MEPLTAHPVAQSVAPAKLIPVLLLAVPVEVKVPDVVNDTVPADANADSTNTNAAIRIPLVFTFTPPNTEWLFLLVTKARRVNQSSPAAHNVQSRCQSRDYRRSSKYFFFMWLRIRGCAALPCGKRSLPALAKGVQFLSRRTSYFVGTIWSTFSSRPIFVLASRFSNHCITKMIGTRTAIARKKNNIPPL